MRKINKIFFFVSGLFLLTFCHSNKIETISTLRVTENLIKHNVNFSDITKEYKFIPLETTNESVIGSIDKIIFHDNKFYILDHLKAKSIFIFSSEGRYLWKLSKTGKGPGEFLDPLDFCFEPGTGNLVVMNLKQLIYYDDKNGTYLRTHSLPIFGYKFDFPDENHISLISQGKEDNLIITDKRGKKLNSFFEYIAETKLILNRPFIRNDKSELLYLANLDYVIYKIEGDHILPYRKIDFTKDMFTPDDLSLLKRDKSNVNNFYRIKYYFEGADKIFILYLYKKTPYYLISDKEAEKTIIVNYNEIKNDVTYTDLLPRIVAYNSDDKIISFLETSELKNAVKNKDIPDDKLKKMLQGITDSTELTDNPILFLFKFK
ncbi:MAG: 6-bladed beta-propeller [Bacteroidia bacterium]|nr:6-bladed beta-propeller [Bacteroidia bacterium]